MRIGTAGWSLPPRHAAAFPAEGSHLARYAQRFTAVEINSSFHRPHRPATYARWAASVPATFRFAVKAPKEISHRRKLVEAGEPLTRFLDEIACLGDRLGPVLVQLPPSLGYEDAVATTFFTTLRHHFAGAVVCEPRHASWFTASADATLTTFRIARVAADPPPAPGAAIPGGWPGLIYHRLHGAPRLYYSAYEDSALDALAATMRAAPVESWCIFDNTAGGEATHDAIRLLEKLSL